ncbi:MAG: stage III sporulation protein AB [Clostridiales bacterium]|nr:stage III sporulation protein AB [Clostridiales bacterium]
MLKGLGALFIILACASFGILAERRIVLRIRALSSLLPALEILKSEIADLLTPIPEAMLILAANTSQPASGLFSEIHERMSNETTFSEAFYAVLRDKGIKIGLYEEDVLQILELVPVLGRYCADEQANKLGTIIRRLEELKEKAVCERDSRGKLYKTMGITLGIVLVLVTL